VIFGGVGVFLGFAALLIVEFSDTIFLGE